MPPVHTRRDQAWVATTKFALSGSGGRYGALTGTLYPGDCDVAGTTLSFPAQGTWVPSCGVTAPAGSVLVQYPLGTNQGSLTVPRADYFNRTTARIATIKLGSGSDLNSNPGLSTIQDYRIVEVGYCDASASYLYATQCLSGTVGSSVTFGPGLSASFVYANVEDLVNPGNMAAEITILHFGRKTPRTF